MFEIFDWKEKIEKQFLDRELANEPEPPTPILLIKKPNRDTRLSRTLASAVWEHANKISQLA